MDDPRVERHQRIAELFAQVVDMPEDERTAAMRSICGADGELRAAVEGLILADARGAPLSTPVLAIDLSQAAASGDALPRELGPYRVVGVLGEGGFGIVYEAEQAEPVRRHVAVKVVKPGMDSRQVIARF